MRTPPPTSSPVLGREPTVREILAITARTVDPWTPLIVGRAGSGRSSLFRALAAALTDASGEGIDGPAAPVIGFGAGLEHDDPDRRLSVEHLTVRSGTIVFVDDVDTLLQLGHDTPRHERAESLHRLLSRPDRRHVLTIEEAHLTAFRDTFPFLTSAVEEVHLGPLADSDLLCAVRIGARGLEDTHEVAFGEDAVVRACAPLSRRSRYDHPKQALRRLEQAAIAVRPEGRRVTAADVEVPMTQRPLTVDQLAEQLGRRIVHQDRAIAILSRRLPLATAAFDLYPDRPDGNFLLYGPTGVGKTALARAVADVLGNPLIRVDMSEHAASDSVSRLIGPPPGFVGYRDREGWLTSQVARQPRAVILLDEIDKADPAVHHLLLQMLDAGRLTDSAGRTVSFAGTVVIMTSNCGSRDDIGFSTPGSGADDIPAVPSDLQNLFPAELLGRVTPVPLQPLGPAARIALADLELERIRRRMAGRGIAVDLPADLSGHLVASAGESGGGARTLHRVIEDRVLVPFLEQTRGEGTAWRGRWHAGAVRWTRVDGAIPSRSDPEEP